MDRLARGYDGMAVVTIDHSAAPRNVATKIEIITMDQVKPRNRRVTIGKIDLHGPICLQTRIPGSYGGNRCSSWPRHSNFYSFGKFHVIQAANEAVDEVRRTERKSCAELKTRDTCG